jgi:electron transfer flavoprotein alpha subunit
VARSKSAVAAL